MSHRSKFFLAGALASSIVVPATNAQIPADIAAGLRKIGQIVDPACTAKLYRPLNERNERDSQNERDERTGTNGTVRIDAFVFALFHLLSCDYG